MAERDLSGYRIMASYVLKQYSETGLLVNRILDFYMACPS